MKTLAILIHLLFLGSIVFAQDQTFKMDEVYPVNSDGIIKLSTDDAHIKITGSDRKDVRVYVLREVTTKGLSWGNQDFRVEVTPSGGDLSISDRTNGSGISIVGYMKEVYKIEIEAPVGVSLSIRGDDDDYQITSINGQIDMRIDDGDAVLKNCKGDSFRFNFDDGNISMDEGRGKLYVKADDGDINIDNANFSKIDATMDDGDIMIQTSLTNNGEYYFKADDAEIVLDVTNGGGSFDIRHDDSRISTSGDFNIIEKDENETRIRMSKGSAIVKMRADDSRIRLSSN